MNFIQLQQSVKYLNISILFIVGNLYVFGTELMLMICGFKHLTIHNQ